MRTSRARRERKNRAQRRGVKFLGFFGAFIAIIAVGCLAVFGLVASWLSDLPDYSNIEQYAESGITTIYANDRETTLAKLYLENRIETTSDKVADAVKEGTVATEDERFYQHSGADPVGIVRALVVNLTGGHEGASTITQQLVRNTVLLDEMNEMSYKRKVREIYIACKIEEQYSKEAILMMYLNVVNYGDGCYGIEAASRDYFGCSASDLTLSQAAMLAGIPQSPTANNPRTNYKQSLARRATVLDRMLRNGYITQTEYDSVINDQPKLVERSSNEDNIANIAPYFVDYVKSLLSSSEEFSASDISKGGLSIYTTLDPKCQKAANAAVKDGLSDWDSEMDGSLTSVDPDTGYIVAMVGGKNYEKDSFNLSTQMSRQAGSSFKTFALLSALNMGVSPDTYIDSSSPAEITDNWTVSNSEGEGHGSMTLTAATTDSVNTVYARMTHVIGAQGIVDMAHACGVTSNLEAVESICLGTQGVNTLEMAVAYATIANGGIHHDPVAITEIADSHGITLYQHQADEGERVLSPALAQTCTDILKTVVEYGSGTSASLWNSSQAVAGKTGTSENNRDLWFVGFCPQYSTAVWTGYRAEKSTHSYGGTVSAPIWRQYTEAVLEGLPTEDFPTTTETLTYKYDWDFPQGTYYDDDDDDYDSGDDSSDNDKSSSSNKNNSNSGSKKSGGNSSASEDTGGGDSGTDDGGDSGSDDSGGSEDDSGGDGGGEEG